MARFPRMMSVKDFNAHVARGDLKMEFRTLSGKLREKGHVVSSTNSSHRFFMNSRKAINYLYGEA